MQHQRCSPCNGGRPWPTQPAMSADDELQLSLLGIRSPATTGPCHARLWLRCRACGDIQARAVSCARPCAQCPWGAMRVSAAHRRLPPVAVRHWVLVPPPRWARALPREPKVARAFRRAVVQCVVSAIERRSRREQGHGRGRAGAMAVLHSVGSDLRPRAHVHVIATDGVFVPEVRGPASFVPLLQPLEAGELRELARIVRREASKAAPHAAPGPRGDAGVRVSGERPAARTQGTVVQARGAEVFVGDRIEAHDRRGSERLTAYVLRPPLQPASVQALGGDRVELKLREPAGDGAVAVQLSKPTFQARVRAMVEGEGRPRLTLHGALAPGSAVRWRGGGTQLSLVEPVLNERKPAKARGGERCACGGRLEVVAAEPAVGE